MKSNCVDPHVRYLPEPIEIPEGHRVDVECTYNTMDMNKPLTNGEGTQDEMCLAFLFVSPRPPMSTCVSKSFNAALWGARNMGWNVNSSNGKFA